MPKFQDLTGQTFTRLTALSSHVRTSTTGKRRTIWLCQCSCGNTHNVCASDLKSGAVKSCGCLHDESAKTANLIDLSGNRYGKLVVIEQTDRTPSGRSRWLCQCDCGGTAKIHGQRLTSGLADSCGCDTFSKKSAALKTHGHSVGRKISPTYHSWAGMHARCSNQNHISYHLYGARGITVCEQWSSFESFLADMGEKPKGTSLDRIDPHKSYSPENCRWATNSQQANNTRNAKRITYNNQSLTAAEWEGITGIPSGTIRARIRLGWSVPQALGIQDRTPPQAYPT